MNILVETRHPAHVHHFKNVIRALERDGHNVKIVAKDKEMSVSLLTEYGFEYEVTGKNYKSLTKKFFGLFKETYKVFKISKKFKADLLVGRGSPTMALLGKLINKPFLMFTDSEHVKINDWLVVPLASRICTPSCFKKDFGKKQVRMNGYFELAYLHPNYFAPNPQILKELGVKKGEKYSVVRFVSWGATHDVGHKGLTLDVKRKLIKLLSDPNKVFITSEKALPVEFEKYRIKISPEKIHDVLYYANLVVSEGGTMATEAALLGTPSIYISSLAGTMGNFIELEKRYGLMYSFRRGRDIFNKITGLFNKKGVKREWSKKVDTLLEDTIDVTNFMIDLIEEYKR